MSGLLDLEGFGLAFESRVILRRIDLSLSRQGCTVLLGPSGTGKSTLLRTLAGMMVGHARIRLWGSIRYQGQPWAAKGELPALVEQKPQLLVSSVWDNLILEFPQRSEKTRVQQMQEVGVLLKQWGQDQLMDQLSVSVIDLPVPQQRIVSILRKAIAMPDLLLVDEPTANLKNEDTGDIIALLNKLSQQMHLLVVSHHQGHSRQIADRIVLIANGVVQEDAPTERFFTDPQSDAARSFLRSGSCPEMGRMDLSEVLAEIGEVNDAGGAVEATQDVTPLQAGSRPAVEELRPQALASFAPAARGPRGFVWLIGGVVAGTPQPGIGVVNDVNADLKALQDVGITRLITLTESRFESPLLAKYGILSNFSPIPDMKAPSLSQTVELCWEIDQLCAKGESVAVHCKAGLGRTGTILAAYWIWNQQGRIKGNEAIKFIRSLEPRMIQSTEQEDFITRFATELRTMSLAFREQSEPTPAA